MRVAPLRGRCSRTAAFASLFALIATAGLESRAASPCEQAQFVTAPADDSGRFRLRFVPGEVVVKFRPHVTAGAKQPNPSVLSDVRKIGETHARRPLELLPEATTAESEYVFRLPGNYAEMSPERERAHAKEMQDIVEEIQRRGDLVEYALVNVLFRPYLKHERVPNDPCFALQWNLHDRGQGPLRSSGGIGMASAWRGSTGRKLVRVAVAIIDTGLASGNPDISPPPRAADGVRFMIGSTGVRIRDRNIQDDGVGTHYHGTHVAGILGAVSTDNAQGIAGVAGNVDLVPVRVFGPKGGAYTDIIDALHWVMGELSVPSFGRIKTPAKVINLSFGFPVPCAAPRFAGLRNAIALAIKKDVIVVAAAGNDGKDARMIAPAGCPGVVTIAASDRQGKLASYSNHGPSISLMAPGGDVGPDRKNFADGILSAYGAGYAYMQGTSMAAPHVAGVIAMVWGRSPKLSAEQVLDRLYKSAKPPNAKSCPNPCGKGLLNADVK